MDILKALVRHGADVKVRSSNNVPTPLHHAAAANKLDEMRFLLDEGADADARRGWKPVHFAVEIDAADAVQTLARLGLLSRPKTRTVLRRFTRPFAN